MSSYGFVDGETYLISGKVSELDVQFRKCFDCVSPDTEDLINILSSVHTQLQLFLDSDLSEVETVLNHVYSCTYIEGVTDLASILLEPFRTDTRFDSYFLFKDLHSPKDRRYSFADSDLGRTDKEWSTGSGEGFKEALQERISYTPSWDKEKEGRILRESTSQKEEQRPPKRLLGGRPLRADARAFSADMVRDILPSDITIPSRLAIATGSIASNLEEFSVSMPLVPRIGSEGICADIQTPKGVGKYTADGRRVHSIVASKRSAFVNRRLNHAAEGGISDCIPLTVNTITGDEDLKQNVLAEKENGAPPVAAISSSNFRSVGEEAEGRIDFVYLTHAELTPSFSPARDIDKVALALPTQEWPDIFHTLNLVRSLALHHAPRLLASPHLKGIVAAITKLVDNLRSALAKNAMLALSDFFSFLSMSGMESEIQRSIDCLVKRSIDRNVFVSQVAEEVMEVVLNCSPIARCLPALLSIVNHRNPQMRGKVCQFLLRVVTLKSLELRGYRDIDAFLNRIPKMISDHTPEARQSTKLIVRALLTTGIVSRAELEIYIASEEIDKVFDKKSVALLQDTKNFTAGVSRRKVTTGVKDTITEAAMIYKTPLIVPLNQGIRMKQGGRRDK